MFYDNLLPFFLTKLYPPSRSGHFFCPVCAHSLVDMSEMWTLYDQHIKDTPLPSVYQNLFTQIYCRDCLKTTRARFHILGIKCTGAECGGYNTVRTKGLLLGKQLDGTCELLYIF